jgi:hypothetical protein
MTFILIQWDDIHLDDIYRHSKEDIHRHPTMDREWNLIMDEKYIRNVVVFLYLFGILLRCRGADAALSADVADPSSLFRSRNTLLISRHARDFASVSASLGRWKWTRLLH